MKADMLIPNKEVKHNFELQDMWGAIIKMVFVYCPILLPLLEEELIKMYGCKDRGTLYKKLR